MAQNGLPETDNWRRAVKWTFVGIFAVALVGGLVGGIIRGSLSDASGAAGHASASGSAPGSGTTSPVSAATAALGSAALLRLTDLPSGWTAGTAAAPTKVTPWSSKLASCVGIPASLASVAPTKVNSPDFTSADQIDAVEDSVSVYPSAAQAHAEYTALAGSKTTGCMNRVAAARCRRTCRRKPAAPRQSGSSVSPTFPPRRPQSTWPGSP